ncbi:hypothetical protein [Paenibacillus vini]|uniref:Uncharacterized protein n=1 Tax=Paenibacillus vini TaxID=1476024 RepID=A0ABQ4MIU3_9BACL|nr:hypothetical protein [Paenibacillus vini]GIP55908.1 hypothetical protein J42TS3_49430 [Paenibacillus vini]
MPSTYDTAQMTVFKMQWEIIADKLKQGVNGIEWLVLNTTTKKSRTETLADWIEQLAAYGHTNLDTVMKDALTMDSEKFYSVYGFNWWMSVSYTLTYLVLLRQRDYDRYFDFLNSIQRS